MRLHEVEPEFRHVGWQPIASVMGDLMAGSPDVRPFILAVDGRSSNGKSTLADRFAAVLPNVYVVHTDDIAWWHSRFGWDDLVISGVIEPLRRGEPVNYRPPAWDARSREGSITVPDDAALVVIEGVGSGRRSLMDHLDAVIWVQTDLDVAEQRNRERVDAGEIDQAGYEGWMAEEVPFQAIEKTWDRADLVVSGLPGDDPGSVLVLHR